MMIVPLFLHVEFEPTDEKPTPATPVAGVFLGYMTDNGLSVSSFKADENTDDRAMWYDVSRYLHDFTTQVANTRIIGWDLRNLEWPAVVANIVKHGHKIPRWLLLPLDEKWNKAPLVDLKNIFVQGGFIEADKWPGIWDVYFALLGQYGGDAGDGENFVKACSEIYGLYEKALS